MSMDWQKLCLQEGQVFFRFQNQPICCGSTSTPVSGWWIEASRLIPSSPGAHWLSRSTSIRISQFSTGQVLSAGRSSILDINIAGSYVLKECVQARFDIYQRSHGTFGLLTMILCWASRRSCHLDFKATKSDRSATSLNQMINWLTGSNSNYNSVKELRLV